MSIPPSGPAPSQPGAGPAGLPGPGWPPHAPFPPPRPPKGRHNAAIAGLIAVALIGACVVFSAIGAADSDKSDRTTTDVARASGNDGDTVETETPSPPVTTGPPS